MAADAKHMSLRAVARLHGVSHSTVAYQLKKLADKDTKGSLQDRQRSRRPHKLSQRMKRHILRFVKQYKWLTPRQLVQRLEDPAHGLCIKVSIQTLRAQILKANNLRRYKAIAKPLITPQNIKKRLAYAKEHANTTNPRPIIATDETPLYLRFATRPYITCTAQEHHNLDNLIPRFKSVGCFQVWTAICHGGRAPLVRLDCSKSTSKRKGVDGTIYVEQVHSCPCATLQASCPQVEMVWKTSIILEDNAPPHKSTVAKAAYQEHHLKKLNHPPSSPDLNPIENAFAELKHRLDVHQPSPHDLEALFELACKLWMEMPQSFFNNLMDSFETRMATVIAASGGAIDH